MCVASLRVLGLSQGASQAQVKTAFLALAKQWHPDRHQGKAKVEAEERFKQLQNAYQQLQQMGPTVGDPRQRYGAYGSAGSSASRSASSARQQQQQQQYWGAQYGHASRPGYDPFKSYMDGNGDPAFKSASERVEASRHRCAFGSSAIFLIGCGLALYTGRRDTAKKARGELVDAVYNQGTRRWETPAPHVLKDPLLSTMVHLKPPSEVYSPTRVVQSSRRPAKAADGRDITSAYKARQQG